MHALPVETRQIICKSMINRRVDVCQESISVLSTKHKMIIFCFDWDFSTGFVSGVWRSPPLEISDELKTEPKI